MVSKARKKRFIRTKDFIRSLFSRFFHLRITQRMFIMYLGVIIIPMSIFSYLTIDIFRDYLEISYSDAVSFNVREIDQTLGTYLMNIFQKSIVMSTSTQLKDLLRTDYEDDPIKLKRDVSAIATLYYNEYDYESIYSCTVYTEDERYNYKTGGFEITSSGNVADKIWYQETINRNEGIYWGETTNEIVNNESIYMLSGYRAIRGFHNDVLGVVRVSVNINRIKELLDEALKGYEASIYIFNEKGEAIELYADSEIDDQLFENIKNEVYAEGTAESVKQQKEDNVLYTYSTIKTAGYKTLIMVTTSALEEHITTARSFMLLLDVVIIALFIIVTYFIAYSISKPIVQLADTMNRTELKAIPSKYEQRNDEISDLYRNFNRMVGSVNNLIKEVEISNEQKRISEIEALQSQINPHFIYNTLNNIQWLAKADKRKEIISTVTSLDKLLRACAQAKGDLVTIEQEFSYANSYLNIQKIRYENRFNFDYVIDFSLLQLKVPMFILQPLIENCILHGFLNKPDGGKIVIKILRKGDNVVFTVKDNGVGFKQKTHIEKKFIPDMDGDGHIVSIGLNNINKRIKLLFGDAYGIQIRSVSDIGTVVRVCIPMIL